MTDLTAMSPDEIIAEAERRKARRAQGLPLEDVSPKTAPYVAHVEASFRGKRAQPEHAEQVAFFERVALDWRTKDLLMTAVPNGGQRHKAVAGKLRAEGVKRGVPDILCFAHGVDSMGQPCHGLAIEMKAGKNKPTEEQKAWLLALAEEGWAPYVCYSAGEAFEKLAHYRGFTP